MQVSLSQATNIDLFTQELEETQGTVVDGENMNACMGPAAVDGFLGFGNEIADVADEQEEQIGVFNIPHELLLKLPIAEVASDTRIIALNPPVQNELGQVFPINTAGPAPRPSSACDGIEANVRPNNPQAPKPGTSGVNVNAQEAMETDQLPENRNDADTEHTPDESQPIPRRPPGVPKKGLNTKNRQKDILPVRPVPPPTQDKEPTLQDRMEILHEIAGLVKNSKGRADMTEMQVWGQYMGLKACRLPEGRTRDEVLVEVEKVMNKGIHGHWGQEE